MKKIIALLIAIAMILPNIPVMATDVVANSASENDAALLSIELLKSLGVVKSGDKIFDKLDGNVTRAEFTEVVMGIINMRGVTGYTTTKGTFNDVPQNYPSANSIYYLRDMGVINGVSQNTFAPDEMIKDTEAISVLLGVLGYGELIKLKGGYPEGVYIVAKESGLITKTGQYTGGVLKASNIAVLLENSLNVYLMSHYYNGTAVQYSMDSKITAMEQYFQTYKKQGIVDADYLVNTINQNKLQKNQVIIDGVYYTIKANVTDNFVGFNVNYFYKVDANQNDEIIYMYKTKRNNELQINARDIVSYDNWKYTYSVEEKNQEYVTISPNIKIIYNDALISRISDVQFIPNDGYITLIDNNNDGEYEILNIVSYLNFLVETVNNIGDNVVKIFGDKSQTSVPVVIDINNTSPTQIKLNGKFVNYKKIVRGEVISVVGKMVNGEYNATRVIVSNKIISGNLDEKNTSNDVKKVIVSGVEYTSTKQYANNIQSLELGSYVILCLDFMGYVAIIRNDGNTMPTVAKGYLIDAKVVQSGVELRAEFKIFSELGAVITYKGANKIMVDGKLYKNKPDDVLKLFQNASEDVISQLLVYNINGNGEISVLKHSKQLDAFWQNNTDDCLLRTYSGVGPSSLMFISETNSFGGKINITKDVLLFHIPPNPKTAETKDFYLGSYDELSSGAKYSIEGYTTYNYDNMISDTVVIYDADISFSGSYPASIVKSYTHCLLPDGTESIKVVFLNNEGEKNYLVKNPNIFTAARGYNQAITSKYSIDVGDIVRYRIDAQKQITFIEVLYKLSSDTLLLTGDLTTTYNYAPRLVSGHAFRSTDQYIQITDKSISDPTKISLSDLETHKFSEFFIVVCEATSTGTLRVRTGNKDDVKTYLDFNTAASKVLLSSSSSVGKLLVVYQ